VDKSTSDSIYIYIYICINIVFETHCIRDSSYAFLLFPALTLVEKLQKDKGQAKENSNKNFSNHVSKKECVGI